MMVVSQGAQWLTSEVYQRLLRSQWREIKEIESDWKTDKRSASLFRKLNFYFEKKGKLCYGVFI